MKVRVRARAAGPKARVGEGELGRPSQVEAIASLYLPLEKVKRVKPGSVMSIQLHYKRGVKRAPKKSTGDRTWDRLTSISKKTTTARDYRLGAMLAIQSELLISHYQPLAIPATARARPAARSALPSLTFFLFRRAPSLQSVTQWETRAREQERAHRSSAKLSLSLTLSNFCRRTSGCTDQAVLTRGSYERVEGIRGTSERGGVSANHM